MCYDFMNKEPRNSVFVTFLEISIAEDNCLPLLEVAISEANFISILEIAHNRIRTSNPDILL